MSDDRIERARTKLGAIRDVLDAHGVKVARNMARCPFHEDRDESFSIYRRDGSEKWRCHACDIGGDVIDLELRFAGVTLVELLDELVPDDVGEPRSRRAASTTPVVGVHAATAEEYLRGRGVTDATILSECRPTLADGRVWLPWLDSAGKTTYRTGRAVNGETPKYKHSPGPKPALFASPGAWDVDVVALVEGQIDALVCASAGTPAFATSGSSLADDAIGILERKSRVLLVADRDEAGAKWLQECKAKLRGRVELAVVELPRDVKDIADVAARADEAGADPEDAAFEALTAIAEVIDGPFRLVETELERIIEQGVPEVAWLAQPYLPAGARVWAFGPAESGKSMWALDVACQLTRQGTTVAYVSQENPLAVDVRRVSRLRPDYRRLRFFHDAGLDLAKAEHRAALQQACVGAELCVLDTLTAVWSGDEEKNAEIAAFDRDALLPLRDAGVAVIVLDHTGHPTAFVKRKGVSAGRGASSKGQKADVVLEFKTEGTHGFVIEHAKNRLGGMKQPPRSFHVVDVDDQTLEIREIERSDTTKATDCMEVMVEAIREAGRLTSSELEALVKTQFPRRDTRAAAMALLRAETPPRVTAAREPGVDSKGRKTKLTVWTPAEETLLMTSEEESDG